MIKDYDYLFKVVLIGSSAVGKSSLLCRYADDFFQQSYLATIGVDFRFKSLALKKGTVKLQIWDTAGQQRFGTITSAYYKGAHGVMMVYDMGDQQTFQEIKDFWNVQIEKYGESNVQLCLLGNKSDHDWKFDLSEVDEFCRQKNIKHFEVSAKTGSNVNMGFRYLAQKLTNIHKKVQKNEVPGNKYASKVMNKKNDVKLRGAQKKKENKLCC